jgi:hypothetical protein
VDAQMTERFTDAFPLHPNDVAALKAEEARRIDEHAELPDIGPEHFDTIEEFNEWVMAGAQRFFV